MSSQLPFAYVWFDGKRLSPDRRSGGRRLRVDARCLAGDPVPGVLAHVCALADPAAALRFDEPEVQQVRRDALDWWVGLLGDDLICLSTFAIDESRYAGAVTAARAGYRALRRCTVARRFLRMTRHRELRGDLVAAAVVGVTLLVGALVLQ